MQGKRTYLTLAALGGYWLGVHLEWWPDFAGIEQGLILLAAGFLRAGLGSAQAKAQPQAPSSDV